MKAIIYFILMLIPCAAVAQVDAVGKEVGDSAYAKGDYQAAIEAYKAILADNNRLCTDFLLIIHVSCLYLNRVKIVVKDLAVTTDKRVVTYSNRLSRIDRCSRYANVIPDSDTRISSSCDNYCP